MASAPAPTRIHPTYGRTARPTQRQNSAVSGSSGELPLAECCGLVMGTPMHFSLGSLAAGQPGRQQREVSQEDGQETQSEGEVQERYTVGGDAAQVCLERAPRPAPAGTRSRH